jgi:hypothetical protein
VLGAFSTLDSRMPMWWGLTVGALIGSSSGWSSAARLLTGTPERSSTLQKALAVERPLR